MIGQAWQAGEQIHKQQLSEFLLASGEQVGLLLPDFRKKCYEKRSCLRAYYAGWKVKTLDFQAHLKLVNDKSDIQTAA